MKPSLEKLQKFFKLEAERGYDNKAVVGGLDQMLEHWEAEARSEKISEDLIKLVEARLRSYPSLSPASRAETLQGIWNRIQRTTNESISALPEYEPEPQAPEAGKTEEEQPSRQPSSQTETIKKSKPASLGLASPGGRRAACRFRCSDHRPARGWIASQSNSGQAGHTNAGRPALLFSTAIRGLQPAETN